MSAIDCIEAEPEVAAPSSAFVRQESGGPLVTNPSPTLRPSASSVGGVAEAKDGSDWFAAGASKTEGRDNRRPVLPPWQKKKQVVRAVEQPRTWLMGDPLHWLGLRIRHRRSSALYTIRRAFASGRVQLERNGKILETYVQTVRAEYEAAN